MRICVDAHTFSIDRPTGVSLYILGLLRGLARCDSQNRYTILANAFRREYADRLSAAFGSLGERFSIELSQFPSALNRRLLDWIWYAWHLPHRMKRLAADILFAPDFVLPSGVRCRCVVTIHDLCPILFPEISDRSIWYSPARQIGQSIRRADLVIADSESVRRDILRIFDVPKENVVPIHLAADPRFQPMAREEAQADAAKRHGLTMPIALCAGTANPRKNMRRMAAAFRLARERKRIEHELVIVGPGTETAVRSGNGIKAIGYVSVEELVALYNAADFFLFPSLYEGFGIPIVEAMSCGTPVITSDRGSMKEVAADAAMLVDPHDVRAMSDAISELAANRRLRADLRNRGIERAKDFSWDKTASETLVVFERAAQ